MIPLPAGCKVNYHIVIEIDSLTDDIGDWFVNVGGRAWGEEFWNYRGVRKVLPFVQYGNAKRCHHHQNGLGGVRLHFDGIDASVASMFILKYMDRIRTHNLKEMEDHVY